MAILIAQMLSIGVTITTLLHVTLGGLGHHAEFVAKDSFTMGVKVQNRTLK